ncbi:TPA: transposase family protein, partial [Escherichia coli]
MSNQHPFMHFDAIPDYRQQGKVEHKLTDIILLTICAVLSGQDDWKAIHLYGTRWLDFLKRFGDFSHGVPSAITIARVMGMISATRLQKCFMEGANKQVISSQADSLIKISRIWADFFPANTSNQPI